MKLKIASFGDTELIIKTKAQAEKLYPNLTKYPDLYKEIVQTSDKQVSPD
jgi:hypothetical protein